MIKVKVTKDFTLGKFNEIKNLKRNNNANNEKGHLYLGDIFECDKNLCDYLMGKNRLEMTVVEVLEIIPEEKPKIEIKTEINIDSKKVAETISKSKTTKKKRISKK